jgi:hypothetical protein
MAQDVPKDEGRNDGIDERPSNADELRDQVDGRDEPGEREP